MQVRAEQRACRDAYTEAPHIDCCSIEASSSQIRIGTGASVIVTEADRPGRDGRPPSSGDLSSSPWSPARPDINVTAETDEPSRCYRGGERLAARQHAEAAPQSAPAWIGSSPSQLINSS